jgi:hypothetical protein
MIAIRPLPIEVKVICSSILMNIQALSTFKQNRLSQKPSKLSVALVGAQADISDEMTAQL